MDVVVAVAAAASSGGPCYRHTWPAILMVWGAGVVPVAVAQQMITSSICSASASE